MRLPEAVEHLVVEMKARYEVDLSGIVAGIRARLESGVSLAPFSIDSDLAERKAPFGLGTVRTSAFESERLRKIVLSEIRLWPVIEGFAVTLIPRAGVRAPCFGADFMLLPARISANADVYGNGDDTRGILRPLEDTFSRIAGEPGRPASGPPWTRAIASGEGLHARVSPRLVADALGAVSGAMGAYFEALERAPRSDGGDGGDAGQRAFFSAFHAHGPRRGPLRVLFGDAWAERYSRLVFE